MGPEGDNALDGVLARAAAAADDALTRQLDTDQKLRDFYIALGNAERREDARQQS
ncbi:hypothetical protein [Cryptosporangium sp. NPDC051539]|uniref:hypothetical protein n=1 Tax=Cryptosporangium sp. NPDC051539 TaxID=3363962 RepID=UPI0037A55C01